MAKLPEVCPEEIVKDAGILTVFKLLVNATTSPAEPAGPFRVTVPVALFPPMTVTGANVTETIARGFNVRIAVFEVAPRVAVTVTEVDVVTAAVCREKLAMVAPVGTSKVAGRVAEEGLAERLTVVPPAGAGPVSVTVPVTWSPPTIDGGLTDTAESADGLIVRPAVSETAPVVALIVAVVCD